MLSDGRLGKFNRLEDARLNAPFGAQCFPTHAPMSARRHPYSLNAPFGAQCFPTQTTCSQCQCRRVSMHLLVLSAFRLQIATCHHPFAHCLNAPFGAQCFPTGRIFFVHATIFSSQCTFWCSVLSDTKQGSPIWSSICLNAPFGAQCFPTSHT